jgi:hypothetical protein
METSSMAGGSTTIGERCLAKAREKATPKGSGGSENPPPEHRPDPAKQQPHRDERVMFLKT